MFKSILERKAGCIIGLVNIFQYKTSMLWISIINLKTIWNRGRFVDNNTMIFLAIGIIFFIIGICLFAIGIAIKVMRENKESLNHRLTEAEARRLSVKNQNLAILLAVISIIISAISSTYSFVQIITTDGFDLPMINDDRLSYPTVQVISVTDQETESETYYNYFEETQATEAYDPIKKETDNNDHNYDNNYNIITNDCILEDTFTESSYKKYYILKTNYSSDYGFGFLIDNIDSRYTVYIEDDKGSIVKEFDIPGNKNTYAVKLNKNCTYTVMVEAKKGYPTFSINISYPENDDF